MPLQMVCKSYLYLTIQQFLSTSIPDHAIIGWPSPVHSLVTPQSCVPKMCFHPPHPQKKNWFVRSVQYEWKELSTLAMVRMSMARLQFQLFSGISGSSLRTAFRCFWMTSTCAQGDGRGWPCPGYSNTWKLQQSPRTKLIEVELPNQIL